MTKISLIAAMAHNRVIGKDNDMPWHMPADLKHFKAVTLGKPVIMGRKTFDSIGRPLPGRRNVVVTRNNDCVIEGVEVVNSPDAAIELLRDHEEVMVIGGGNIYQQFLSTAETLYLTFIDLDVDGDTQFPDWNSVADWQEVDQQEHLADEQNKHNYTFVKLIKTA